MARYPTIVSGTSGDGADESEDDPGYDDGVDVNIKEALGLPDALPPIRLPPVSELAAQARQAPLPNQLRELAEWVGPVGREVRSDGLLPESGEREACAALGVTPRDLGYLWEYALAVEWLIFEEDDDERISVLPGEMARAWIEGDDYAAFDVWSSTLAAVLTETLIEAGPDENDDWAELGLEDLDFDGQPLAMVVLLFLARREGLSITDFTEVLWENACGDLPPAEAGRARVRWLTHYENPADLLLEKLEGLHAITLAGDTIQLSPLALTAMHEQLVDAGVDIPLLPATAAELTGSELLAMAEGVPDEEFEAESRAWIATRGADSGARELLRLGAAGDPGERMLAVAAVTRIGAAAEPAWRDSLDVPELRGYAKIALTELAGGEDRPDLRPLPDDLAWITTDMLALACDEEFPDPEEIAATFREAVPEGQEAAVFELMWRGPHPDAADVLNHVGRYHPDKKIAKAARTAAYKAISRRASNH